MIYAQPRKVVIVFKALVLVLLMGECLFASGQASTPLLSTIIAASGVCYRFRNSREMRAGIDKRWNLSFY